MKYSLRGLAAVTFVVLCAGPLAAAAADVVSLDGPEILIDDAWFRGCFHNAFEGEVLQAEDGGRRTGPQGIRRTKGVLFGADTRHARMELRFRLEAAPAGDVRLVLNGLDDRFSRANVLEVTLNDVVVVEGLTFTNNAAIGTSTRYYVGWEDKALIVPASVFRAGENVLAIRNTTSVLGASDFCFALIDWVRMVFPGPTRVELERPPHPPYYYGLSEGVELNVWPSINLGRMCLLVDGEIEYNFYITLPRAITDGEKDAAAVLKEAVLHIVTDGDIEVSTLSGEPFARSREGDLHHFQRPAALRGIGWETPHPGQGIRLLLRASKPFEGRTLTAWLSAGDVPSLKRTYPLGAAKLPEDGDRMSDFLLSIWGGGIPQEAEARQRYIGMVSRAGFSRMFTGETAELNRELKAAGFAVYPRYGWFAGKFNVPEGKGQWASVSVDGTPSTRDYCPLAILEHADDPDVGRYFATAAKMAELSDVDGLCVDFECGAVWCWCDRCVALFEKETGQQVGDRAELGSGGAREEAYKAFGRRRNGALLARVKAAMRDKNPALRYCALASACDMTSYWWDGRIRGRHSLRELAKFADEIALSGYFYGLPGGLKSVLPLIRTTKQFALESGRDIDVSIISPLATTVSETPRYRGAVMLPSEARLEVLLAAAGGGRGLSFFRGDCFDGLHYLSIARAVSECARLEPYIRSRLDRSFEVTLTPVGEVRREIDLTMAQNLISRLEWRPDLSYAYDVVMLNRDTAAKDRVYCFFNYAEIPLEFSVTTRGLFDPRYDVHDLMTGRKLASYSRFDMETGAPTVTVPARDCVMWRVETAD